MSRLCCQLLMVAGAGHAGRRQALSLHWCLPKSALMLFMPRVSRRTCAAFASALFSAARLLATSLASSCPAECNASHAADAA